MKLRLFPPCGPLEYVAMVVLGLWPKTKSRNKFFFVITDQYLKVTKAISRARVAATAVAKIFVDHRISNFGTSSKILTNNGPPCTSKFFQPIRDDLRITSLMTTN